jgi:hypothetical protein
MNIISPAFCSTLDTISLVLHPFPINWIMGCDHLSNCDNMNACNSLLLLLDPSFSLKDDGWCWNTLWSCVLHVLGS